MNAFIEKKSPFYPDQPVPLELFVGRESELNRITERGMGQVRQGKSVSFFVRGDYGIGKSSLARYLAFGEAPKYGIFPIYAQLAGCKSLDDVAIAILRATIETGFYNPKGWKERLGKFLGDFIGDPEFMGFRYDFNQLKRRAPEIASHHGLLNFLHVIYTKLKEDEFRGIFLILDEINGIVSNPDFAQFLKGLWDANAMQMEDSQVPLLMMLCGVEQRRVELINAHMPVNRIFDVVDIGALSMEERTAFFTRAFDSVFLKYEDDAIKRMAIWSSGFPKVMHLIGDTVYWLHTDSALITSKEAFAGIREASEIIGRKYFEPNVLHALQSSDYISILKKVADILNESWKTMFTRTELKSILSPKEERKLDNFLRRMKSIHAITPAGARGEYQIINNMIFMYIVLKFSSSKL